MGLFGVIAPDRPVTSKKMAPRGGAIKLDWNRWGWPQGVRWEEGHNCTSLFIKNNRHPSLFEPDEPPCNPERLSIHKDDKLIVALAAGTLDLSCQLFYLVGIERYVVSFIKSPFGVNDFRLCF